MVVVCFLFVSLFWCLVCLLVGVVWFCFVGFVVVEVCERDVVGDEWIVGGFVVWGFCEVVSCCFFLSCCFVFGVEIMFIYIVVLGNEGDVFY